MSHTHDHGEHGHSHAHHPEPLSPAALKTKAVEALLIEKGLLATDAVDRVVELYEKDLGPLNGAKVVARAWVDPEFRQRLLENAVAAMKEIGIHGLEGENIAVKENTNNVHNVICCTLCSCYPWSLLGLPPVWYKSPAYRSRIVIEPRKVLGELGLEIDPAVEIRVWDSTAELRYLVLPQRPSGSEAMTEEQLAAIVTRDAMIGVEHVKLPGGVHHAR
jgi:nitrile hydratase subunit alpha